MAAKTTLELVKAALDGRRAAREYPFPGVSGVSVLVRVLTDDELDGCRRRAAAYVERLKVSMLIDPEMFDRALRREIIAMAYQETDGSALFGKAKEVGELDDATVIALYQQYTLHHELCMPWESGGEEELEALTEALGKSDGSGGALSLFDAPTLRRFVVSMARRLRALSQTSK